MISSHQQQIIIIIAIIRIQTLPNDARSKNNRLTSRSRTRHLSNEIKIMLTWHICNINWSTTHTSCRCMEAGVVGHSLKHIPIWDDIEVLSKERIVGVGKDVPWMTCWDFREEIVGVAD